MHDEKTVDGLKQTQNETPIRMADRYFTTGFNINEVFEPTLPLLILAMNATMMTMVKRVKFLVVALILAGLIIVTPSCGAETPTPLPSFTPLEPSSVSPSPMLTPTYSPTAEPSATAIVPTATRPPAASPSPTRHIPTPTAPTVLLATPTPHAPVITFSPDGAYGFPVAGDLGLMTWTHFHWDGGNAVDIEAARALPARSNEFNTFIRLPVSAVTSGTVTIADNLYGGLALLIQGDDGHSYYYGHLSEQVGGRWSVRRCRRFDRSHWQHRA